MVFEQSRLLIDCHDAIPSGYVASIDRARSIHNHHHLTLSSFRDTYEHPLELEIQSIVEPLELVPSSPLDAMAIVDITRRTYE